jgi:hypothetical protein
VVLTKRIVWFPGEDGQPRKQPQENHVWLVWDWSRTPGPARLLFADKDPKSEPEARSCIVCRTPLPSTARLDARLCSAACRQEHVKTWELIRPQRWKAHRRSRWQPWPDTKW